VIPDLAGDLRRYSLFAGVGDEALGPLLDRLERRHWQAGDTIVAQGAHDEGIYFIREGRVRVEVDGIQIAVLHEGEQFGEMHLIDVQVRSAAVIASTGVETLRLSHRELLGLRKTHPEAFILILMNCARDVSRRLRESNRRYAALLRRRGETGADDAPA